MTAHMVSPRGAAHPRRGRAAHPRRGRVARAAVVMLAGLTVGGLGMTGSGGAVGNTAGAEIALTDRGGVTVPVVADRDAPRDVRRDGRELGLQIPGPPPPLVPDAAGDRGATDAQARDPARDRQQAAAPVSISIPRIEVAADVIELGLNPDRTLEVPQDFAQTGWWSGGPEPGEVGPAVVAGHVDSYRGPAVFWRLHELRRGDRVEIRREDGSSVTFAVTGAVRAPKDYFPTELVYGPTEGAELRLITCDGTFVDGSYVDNLIVTAERVSEAPPPLI